MFGDPEAASVGYFWETEQEPGRLDYALIAGMEAVGYGIHDTPDARKLSDHLPLWCDVLVGPRS